MRWIALRPIHGRAGWARAPLRVISMRSVPWQPASSFSPGGLAQDGDVALEQLRPVAQQVGEPVVLGGHLLARVEDVGDVHRGGRDLPRQGEHHGQAALHVRRTEAPEDIAVQPRFGVPVHGDRVGVAGEHHPPGPSDLGPGHEVGPDPFHDEVREDLQLGLEVIRERRFVVAHGRDRHEGCREREQVGIGHPPTVDTVGRRDRHRSLHRRRTRRRPRDVRR